MAAPEIKKGPPVMGQQLPQGAAGQLNAAMSATGANQAPPTAAAPAGSGFDQGQETQGQLPPEHAALQDVLFAPTSRPNEPITAGVPWGPGTGSVHPDLTPDEQLRISARSILQNPEIDSRAKSFFTRVLNGE